jgi:eukaryotic-like serine/threonine-protein kinase
MLKDRYLLSDQPLALGGMGEIWLARDLALERTVVVKQIRLRGDASDIDRIHRFKREARLTAALDHPGVPAIYDIGFHPDQPFIVMQRIHGIDVGDLAAEQPPLPIGWVATIGAQVSCVLMAAHRAGLIHRDIKPSNVMLERGGTVKVLDFGLAAFLDRDDLSRITRSGESIGTPSYMAPEQVLGEPCTAQTDLYGLGCTLHDLLTGQPPFTASTSYAIMNMHMTAEPVRLRRSRRDVPKRLDELILSMLEKKPDNRPANAAEVHRRLLEFIGDPPALSGVLAPETDPTRSYIMLGGRLPAGAPVPAGGHPFTPPEVDREQLKVARERAAELRKESHAEQAAQILGALVEPARITFGPKDADVLELRTAYAAALHEAGRHRAVAREQRSLARDLAELHGPDDERVLDCRLQAARAHLRMGEMSRAHKQFGDLLQTRLRISGPNSTAVGTLRAEMAAFNMPDDQPEP